MFSNSLLHPSVLSGLVLWTLDPEAGSFRFLFVLGQGKDGGVELHTWTAAHQNICYLSFHHVKLNWWVPV